MHMIANTTCTLAAHLTLNTSLKLSTYTFKKLADGNLLKLNEMTGDVQLPQSRSRGAKSANWLCKGAVLTRRAMSIPLLEATDAA